MAGPAIPRRIRFGEFEADLVAGELRKNGSPEKIVLQEQPLAILRALVARPGEMVSREELIQLLWKGNTNVDFDPSLNKAINRLRESLGESAEAPRYIETVSRRGYRWMERVEWTASGPANLHVPISRDLESGKTNENQNERNPLQITPIRAAGFSPCRQLALLQTLFLVPAVLVLIEFGEVMTWNAGLLVTLRPWWRLSLGIEAALSVASVVFTGVNALELWRGDIEAVRFFRRFFLFYLLFDVFTILRIFVPIFYYMSGFPLLPILVLLPFYQ